MTMPNGSYHWYPAEATRPVLAEVHEGWVWLIDADRAQPIAKMQGRFVRLVEESQPLPVGIPALSPPEAATVVDNKTVAPCSESC